MQNGHRGVTLENAQESAARIMKMLAEHTNGRSVRVRGAA